MENYVTFARPTSNRFNLVCDNQHLQRLLGTFTMTGLLLGSLIGGRCGDYFGRKKVLYAACLVISVVLGIASLSTSYPMFAACHIIYREELNFCYKSKSLYNSYMLSPDIKNLHKY